MLTLHEFKKRARFSHNLLEEDIGERNIPRMVVEGFVFDTDFGPKPFITIEMIEHRPTYGVCIGGGCVFYKSFDDAATHEYIHRIQKTVEGE